MKIDVIRSKYNLVYNYARNNDTRILTPYLEYLSEAIKSPTLSRLHANDVAKEIRSNSFRDAVDSANREGLGVFYTEFKKNINAKNNLKTLKMINLSAQYQKEYQRMYPSTGKLRNKLIKLERIYLGQVKPKTKLSLKEKLFISLPDNEFVDFLRSIVKK